MREVKIIGSLGLLPMCPKKKGLRRVKIQDSIAISLLKIFLFTKNKPIIPIKEKNQFTACLTSIVYLVSIKLLNDLRRK